jgi:hypothetical protein
VRVCHCLADTAALAAAENASRELSADWLFSPRYSGRSRGRPRWLRLRAEGWLLSCAPIWVLYDVLKKKAMCLRALCCFLVLQLASGRPARLNTPSSKDTSEPHSATAMERDQLRDKENCPLSERFRWWVKSNEIKVVARRGLGLWRASRLCHSYCSSLFYTRRATRYTVHSSQGLKSNVRIGAAPWCQQLDHRLITVVIAPESTVRTRVLTRHLSTV